MQENKNTFGNLYLKDIYTSIRKFYPIGLNYENPYYKDFLGTIELQKLYKEKLEENAEYKNLKINYSGWKVFLKSIENDFDDHKVNGSSNLMQPSYGGFISVKKIELEVYSIFQSLHFYVSLLGPFFTVFGLDRINLKNVKGQSGTIQNVIYVSPTANYEQHFKKLRYLIEESFNGYQFIPYRVSSLKMPGLFIPYESFSEASIFQALFSPQNIDSYIVRGDKRYGLETFLKHNNDENINHTN